MTQIGEGVYTPPERPAEQDDGKIHLNIRVHVYNDGTSNNRTNTESRIEKKEAYLALEKRKDSYENDLTNVAIMEKYMRGLPTPGYDHTLSVYVEGPGTIDHEADRPLGYGIGMGEAGVRNKVERGLTKIVDKIKEAFEDVYKKDKEIVIDLLTLDLFGFSRGAAVARNMVHEALFGRQRLTTRLGVKEYTTHRVEIDFVGLYDTVSSHGLFFILNNDTRVLKLDAIRAAKAVLHLVAADEHRENFSLTDIRCVSGVAKGKGDPGPAPKGREIFLPGAHSDIGGSYLDGVIEEQTIYDGFMSDAEQDRARLIAAGWYEAHEITLEEVPPLSDNLPPGARLKVRRPRSIHADREEASLASLVQGGEPFPRDPRLPPPRSLPNSYHRIPLQIMARAVRERGIEFDEEKFNKSAEIPDPLWEVAARIDRYVAETAKRPSSAEDWHDNDPWLRRLRHDYLHFSARIEFGLGPRFSGGRRQRMTYAG